MGTEYLGILASWQAVSDFSFSMSIATNEQAIRGGQGTERTGIGEIYIIYMNDRCSYGGMAGMAGITTVMGWFNLLWLRGGRGGVGTYLGW